MQKKTVALLALSHFVTDVNQGVLPALLPVLIATHHLSYAAAAGLVFGTNISSSIVQPLFGIFADKIEAAWIMPLGVFLAGLGLALAGLTPSYWLMFLAVAVSGMGIAAFHPEGARFVNIISGEKKATGLSLFSTGGNLGFAAGPLVATLFLTLWGLKGSLILLLPVTVMSILLMSLISKPISEHHDTKNGKLSEGDVGKNNWGAFGRLTVALTCRSAVFWSLNTFLPLYLVNVLKEPKEKASFALTILLIAGATGNLIAGRLADRYGNLNITRAGLLALVPMLVLFLLINNANLLMILLIPMGMILFAPLSPMVVLGQSYLPENMGLASGVTLGLAVSVGAVVAPVLGWIADHYSIHIALSSIVFLPLVAAVMAFTLKEPHKKTVLTA